MIKPRRACPTHSHIKSFRLLLWTALPSIYIDGNLKPSALVRGTCLGPRQQRNWCLVKVNVYCLMLLTRGCFFGNYCSLKMTTDSTSSAPDNLPEELLQHDWIPRPRPLSPTATVSFRSDHGIFHYHPKLSMKQSLNLIRIHLDSFLLKQPTRLINNSSLSDVPKRMPSSQTSFQKCHVTFLLRVKVP